MMNKRYLSVPVLLELNMIYFNNQSENSKQVRKKIHGTAQFKFISHEGKNGS